MYAHALLARNLVKYDRVLNFIRWSKSEGGDTQLLCIVHHGFNMFIPAFLRIFKYQIPSLCRGRRRPAADKVFPRITCLFVAEGFALDSTCKNTFNLL